MFGVNYAPGPDHNPKLTGPVAAHETAAVLRMHRSGMPAPKICGLLKISKQQLVHELRLAIDQEQDAHQAGMPIHDVTAKLELETKSKYAKDVMPGEYLVAHGAYVWTKHVATSIITFTLPTGERVRYAPYDKINVSEGRP